MRSEAPVREQRAEQAVWNRPLPRWANYLLILLAVLAALIVVPNIRALHVYEKYFRGNEPEAQIRFEALSPDWDEAAAQRHFTGLPMRCLSESNSPLGNRVCFASISKANGNPALTLALFFKAGRLNVAVLQVPWWAHGRVRNSIIRQWGAPAPSGTDGTGWSIGRWELPNGRLEMNNSRFLNPLSWSAVMWGPK
jgi:hypothetical protein